MNLRRTAYMSPEGGGKAQNGCFSVQKYTSLGKSLYEVSLCENRQRQSCKAFIGLSIWAKMIGWGRPLLHVEGLAPTNHSSQKTRLNDLSYGIKIWTDLSSVLSQSTRLTDRRTDRQTEEQTEFSSLDSVCIPCSAVKTLLLVEVGFQHSDFFARNVQTNKISNRCVLMQNLTICY